jgi:hypothetical protein
VKFRTVIRGSGKTTAGIHVPEEVVAALGKGKRPAVRVTINGRSYRSSVAVLGGQFMVGVSAENRNLVGVAAGDEVDVDIELDDEPREVTVPPDFMRALRGEAEAKRFFDGLSFSKKQRFVLSVEGAKTAETRQRRIDKALGMLREGRRKMNVDVRD